MEKRQITFEEVAVDELSTDLGKLLLQALLRPIIL